MDREETTLLPMKNLKRRDRLGLSDGDDRAENYVKSFSSLACGRVNKGGFSEELYASTNYPSTAGLRTNGYRYR